MSKRAGLTAEQSAAIDRFFEQIQKNKIDQEARRDQLAVLIAGGALTVSFAFVGGLTEHDEVNRIGWLIAAWVVWALALVGALVGYTISIYANNAMLEAMSKGEYDLDVITPTYGKYIERVNIAVMVLVMLGFVAFGTFVLGNLDGNQEKGQEESIQEDEVAVTPQAPGVREQPTHETSQLAPGKTDENGGGGGRMSNGRNEERGLTLPAPGPRYPSEPTPQPAPSQPPSQPTQAPTAPSQGGGTKP